MRQTVDEKLQGTLEKRLGESFKLVSERLEQVSQGLGEMQTLATGVGDLKRVLTNVKTRGTWGEVQLAALLEEVLTPDQYATNVATKDGGRAGRVRHQAARPRRRSRRNRLAAHRRQVPHRGLPAAGRGPGAGRSRGGRGRRQATGDSDRAARADICDKYLEPAEDHRLRHPVPAHRGPVCRGRPPARAGRVVQRDCRVVIAGPTTLWSILNSLQMGFRTLAIQKRSSEVWNLLAAVKTEWQVRRRAGQVQKKLQEASGTLSKAVAPGPSDASFATSRNCPPLRPKPC